MTDYTRSLRDITEAKAYYPQIDFRYVVRPSKPLPETNGMFAYTKSQR